MKPLAAALLAVCLIVLAAAAVAPRTKRLPPATGKVCGHVVPAAPAMSRPLAPGSLDEVYTSTDVPKSIPDDGFVTSTLAIPEGATVSDLNVQLTITHTWIRDLRISLISPDQVEVVLLDLFYGDSVVNMTNTWFNDEVVDPIDSAQAPFTGGFIPQNPLAAFDGHPAGGVWTLRVEDRFPLDTGSIQSWALEINAMVNLAGTVTDARSHESLANVEVALLDTGLIDATRTDAAGHYRLESLPAGSFTVRFTRPYYDTLWTGVSVSPDAFTALDTAIFTPYRAATSTADTVPIPDEGVASMALRITRGIPFRDLDVTVNIEHTYSAELSLVLYAPHADTVAGDSVILVPIPNPCPPASGEDLIETRFDDQAAQPYAAGWAPYTGSWRPYQPLRAFYEDTAIAATSEGEWTLVVRDNCEFDVGRILGFTLYFLPADAVPADPPRAAPPRLFTFDGAYPNPFNSRTQFRFSLPQPLRVRLALYNALGQEAAVVTDALFPAGSHVLSFDAGSLASGLYIARLSAAGGAAQNRKLVLLR